MWGHQRCPDVNCFYQLSQCERLVVATGSLQCAYLPFCLILNPDPIWLPQHFNSQETHFFYNFLLEYSRATEGKNTHPEYICTPKNTARLQSNYIHKDEICAHAFVITFIWTEGNCGAVSTWNHWKYNCMLLFPDIISFEGSCCHTDVLVGKNSSAVYRFSFHSDRLQFA